MSSGRAAVIAAFSAFLVCLPTVRGGFVIDDAYLVVENPAIRRLGNIPSFFAQPWGGGSGGTDHAGINAAYYRPVTTSLHAVEHAVLGLRASGWHVVSCLLHALASAVAALLACRIVGAGAALPAGLLFAVHPVHTEAVAAICYQTTLLAALLAMLALWSLARSLEGGRAKAWVVAAALLTVLAGLAKEEAAVIPLFTAAWAVLGLPAARRRMLVRSAELLAAAVAVVAVRAAVVAGSSVTFFGQEGRATVVATMLRVVALYADLLVVPLRLCPFYDWFIVMPSPEVTWDVVRGAGIAAAVVAAIVGLRRRAPAAALGFAWLALGLLPVLHFVPILNVAAERFLYLPSLGLVLVAASLYAWAVVRRPRLAVMVAAALILLFGVRTLVRWPDWRDDRALNLATIAAYPQTPTPHLNLAHMDLAAGDPAAALRHLQEAERCAPDWPLPRKLAAAIKSQATFGGRSE